MAVLLITSPLSHSSSALRHLVALARLHGVHDLNTALDLNLGNVEATPHVELCTASPLPPPTLEDVHPQA
ncbi:hypothetical protein GG344DRAFT_81785 [Lentinula edodes]|nr:hypothetical protein GG344DRAFT_81785 [Lentinula edodes]